MTARAGLDVPAIDCEPEVLVARIRQVIDEWKPRIEAVWCGKGKRALYPIVVRCKKPGAPAAAESLRTWFEMRGNGIDTARIFLDPTEGNFLSWRLPHELGHAIFPGCMPLTFRVADVPAWVEEGMATYTDDGLLEDASSLLVKDGAPALDPLTNLFFETELDRTMPLEAALLVKFLVDEQGGPEKWKEFVVGLKIGQESYSRKIKDVSAYSEAFRKYYGMTLAELETGYRAFVVRVLGISPAKKAGGLPACAAKYGAGEYCGPAGATAACRDPKGREITVRCCPKGYCYCSCRTQIAGGDVTLYPCTEAVPGPSGTPRECRQKVFHRGLDDLSFFLGRTADAKLCRERSGQICEGVVPEEGSGITHDIDEWACRLTFKNAPKRTSGLLQTCVYVPRKSFATKLGLPRAADNGADTTEWSHEPCD